MTITDDEMAQFLGQATANGELSEPPPPSGRICTYAGCENQATERMGARPKNADPDDPLFNRCSEHGQAYSLKRAHEANRNKPRTSKDSYAAPAPGGGERKARKGSLEQRLAATIGLVGTVVYALDAFDGTQILVRGDQLAKALDHLAAENPAVRRVLEAMMAGGAWGEVVMVLAPMAVAILAHHKVIPEQYASFADVGV